MLVRNIEIRNFKNFNHISIQPSNFNVIIGPNSVGKSNFLSIFKFIRDIVSVGLENAISLQGGIEHLMNLNSKGDYETSFHIEIEMDNLPLHIKKFENKNIKMILSYFTLDFIICNVNNDSGFYIREDNIEYQYKIINNDNNENISETTTEIITLNRKNENISIDLINSSSNLTLEDIFPPITLSITDSESLFIENKCNFAILKGVNKVLKDISIYNFGLLNDNILTNIMGKVDLEDNGENIAIVLNKLLKDKDKKRKILNHIQYVLPFIEDIDVEKILDKHLHIILKENYSAENNILENYSSKNYTPSYILSTGTMTIIALVIALFLENESFIFLDEPCSRIHPFLISRIIELMKEASIKTQIFVTTHHSEMVKCAGIENIFGIKRDLTGNSVINKLSQQAEVLTFLNNEIGLDELFIQNLLSK